MVLAEVPDLQQLRRALAEQLRVSPSSITLSAEQIPAPSPQSLPALLPPPPALPPPHSDRRSLSFEAVWSSTTGFLQSSHRILVSDEAVFVVVILVLAGESSSPAAHQTQDSVLDFFDACEFNRAGCSAALNATILTVHSTAGVSLLAPPSPPPPPPPPPEPPKYDLNDVLLIVFLTAAGFLLLVLFVWIFFAIRWYRRYQASTLASAPTLHPPTCKWPVRFKGGFACFLSHYKAEAGSDARYVHDLLQRMLQADIFLDSNDLADLRTLFAHVHNSDVLLLLATEGVLSRPWCLLELYQAHRHGVPVLIVEVDSPRYRFDRTAAKRFLRNLEEDLPQKNPGAISEIQKYLTKAGDAIAMRDFRDILLDALEPQLSSSSQPLKFHPWGTDNTVLADATDIIHAMATAHERRLKFKQPKIAPRSAVLVAACIEYMRRTLNVRRRPPSSLRRRSSSNAFVEIQYALFISYFREEAGCDARLLQLLLHRRLKRPVFLDATDADDIRKIITAGVLHSDALLLVQTQGVLTRPWCLLEIYAAIRNGVPVLPLNVEGGDYNFDEARMLLGDIENRLEELNPGAPQLLRDLLADGVVPVPDGTAPASLKDMEKTLSKTIPFLISGSFNPSASEHHFNAAVKDVLEKADRAIKARAARSGQLTDHEKSGMLKSGSDMHAGPAASEPGMLMAPDPAGLLTSTLNQPHEATAEPNGSDSGSSRPFGSAGLATSYV